MGFVDEFVVDYISAFAQNKGYEIVNEKKIEKRLNYLAETLFVMSEKIDDTVIREYVLDYIEKYIFERTSLKNILSDEEIDIIINDFRSQYHKNLDKDSQAVLISCIKKINEDVHSILNKSDLIILRTIENGFSDIAGEVRYGFNSMNKKLDNIKVATEARSKSAVTEEKKAEIKINVKPKVRSRTKEYAGKWNSNMFLNNFDKRDENAGINVKLGEVYIEDHLPHYIWKENSKSSTDLKELLTEYIENKENQMLLVLGHPGIGKSTLITWILANFIKENDNILVYQFASDLKNIQWKDIIENGNLADEILKNLGLADTLEGKTLILDGFDEISVGSTREEILNYLYRKLVKNRLEKFSLIITCRENYIQDLKRLECNYITLQPWDEKQIRSFCKLYGEKVKRNISNSMMFDIINKKKILGIPLILYMVLALDIEIKGGSMVDVYDQIFSLEVGGIYDRCIRNISYGSSHRIKKIRSQIHLISMKIAMWMFENKHNEAYIPKKEYEKICDQIRLEQTQNDEDIKEDFLIGNYFRLVKHCEGMETESLYFVHRSIYEYFVAINIYNSIEKIMEKRFSDKSQEELAGSIAVHLKLGMISEEIGDAFLHKTKKLYYKFEEEKKEGFYQWWEIAVEKMMDVGMFYYTKKNIHDYQNIIFKECYCFANLTKILSLLLSFSNRTVILQDVNDRKLKVYVQLCDIYNIKYNLYNAYLDNIVTKTVDLHGKKLVGADLRGANLKGANLSKMNLSYTILYNAILLGTDFNGTILNGVDFRKAYLYHADFTNAELKGAIFDEDQITYLLKRYDLRETKVFINKTNEIINYEEYFMKNLINY